MRRRHLFATSGTAVLSWMVSFGLAATAAAQAPATAPAAELQSYLAGNGFLNRGLYELAISEYRKFLSEREDHEKAPLARYGLGVALFRLNKYEEAAAELTTLWKKLDQEGKTRRFEYSAEVSTILGQCHLQLGHYKEAAAAFARVRKNQPDHTLADAACAGEIEALYREKELAGVQEASERFVSRSPDSPLRARVEFYWGLSLMARKEFEDAAAHFSESLDKDSKGPFSEQASLLLAQCLEHGNALEQAIRQYRRIVKGDSTRFTADALFSLGLLLHREGKLDDAGRQLDRLFEKFPKSPLVPAARLLRGRVWFDQEAYDNAFASYEKALSEESASDDSVQAEPHYWMAKCELRQGKAAEAASRLRKAIATYGQSPLLPQMRYDLGVALLQAGKDDDAAEAFSAFRTEHPDHELAPDALELLATIEHRRRHFDRSLDHCRTFLRDYPDHEAAPRVAFVLAEDLFLGGDTEQAVKAYRDFIERFPNDPDVPKAKLRLGTSLHRLERFDESQAALADVVGAAREDATYRPALIMLGDIQFQRGEWKKAEGYLTTYLKDGLDVPAADEALLKLGLSLQRQSKPEEAVRVYDRLLEHFSEGPARLQAAFERGQSLVMLDRPEDAAAAFQKVVEVAPKSRFAPFALNHLAAIASKQGKFDEAAKLYERVAAAGGGHESMGAEAMFLRAENLMGAKEFGEAGAAFETFLQQYPSDPKAATAKVQLAIALSRQDRCKDAVEAFDKCEDQSASLQPSLRASAIYEKAWCLRELGELERATEAYRKLIDEDLPGPLTMHALLELAGIEQEAGRFESASELLTRLRKLLHDAGDGRPELAEQGTYRLAVCEFEQEHLDQAAEYFGEFVSRFDQSPLLASASFYAGEALFKLGRFESAIEHLQRVVKRFEDDEVYGPALLRLGESLAKVQHFSASEKAFSEYLERFPDSEHWYQAQFGIGWAREQQKRWDEAINAYGGIVGKHAGPTAARAQFQIGECLFAMKKYEDAARELLKVDILYAYPEWSAAALFEAGRCFEEMNQTALARDNFQKVATEHKDTQWGRMAAQRLSTLTSGRVPGQ